MKKIIMTTLALLAMCTAAAYAAEEPYFGYELDGNTLTVMENWEFDKTEYQDKLFVLIYDGDKIIKAAPAPKILPKTKPIQTAIIPMTTTNEEL